MKDPAAIITIAAVVVILIISFFALRSALRKWDDEGSTYAGEDW